MDRNIFQTLNDTQYENWSDLSDEEDISDDDADWQPPVEAGQLQNDEQLSSSDSDSDPEVETILPSCSTSIDETVNSDDVYCYGKDKVTIWKSTPYPDLRPPQNRLKLPLNRFPNTNHVTKVSDSFLLYIDSKIIQTIVTHTNAEAVRVKGDAWKDTNETEIQALIGCLIHAGSMHQNQMSLDVIFNVVDGNPLIRATFPRTRFHQLLNHLRFDDKLTRNNRRAKDKFAPVRDVWELFQKNLAKFYHPDAYLTVDEQLVPFRGRCAFVQYMPSKPDKYGLKVFWICESSTSYPLKGIPYLGKGTTSSREATGDSVGSDIVKNLTERFKDSGRNVTTENFFTDLNLAENLLKNKLSIVGTVRRNKRFLPEKFQNKKELNIMNSSFLFREGVALVSFQGKKNKNTILLSTMHNDVALDDDTQKPEIVMKYNKTKGGVDSMDQMAHAFSVKRKTKRWPLVVFFNMIDLAGIAGRVIWSNAFPNNRFAHKDNRQLFLIQAAKELVYPQIQQRSFESRTMNIPYRQNLETVLKSLTNESNNNKEKTTSKRKQPSKQQTPQKATPSKRTANQPSVSTPPSVKKPKCEQSPAQTPGKTKARCRLCPSVRDRKTASQCNQCKKNICGEHGVLLCINCCP